MSNLGFHGIRSRLQQPLFAKVIPSNKDLKAEKSYGNFYIEAYFKRKENQNGLI